MKKSWTVLKLQSWHNLTIWNKQRGIIMSELKEGLRFFFIAHCLIIHYLCAKFEILYGFKVIEQTENIAIWTLTLTFIGQDWFMNSAHCLCLANIWAKFRKHPSIYERDMEQTQKVNGQADNVKT